MQINADDMQNGERCKALLVVVSFLLFADTYYILSILNLGYLDRTVVLEAI